MNKRFFIYLTLLLIVPISYLIFKKQIEAKWSSIDTFLTITTYWASILLFWYNSDLKFFFFVNRFTMLFKSSHTTWLLSCRYRFIEFDHIISLELLKDYFLKSHKTIRIKAFEPNYLEILLDNKFLLYFKIQQFDYGNYELHFYTSKIVVPTKENKKQIAEIKEILEGIEGLLNLKITDVKDYEIDIEYNNKSPYYSYWMRKMPEEIISNFNCNINLPNQEEKITINKNHLKIRSDKYTKLFELANDYVSLKST